MRNRACTACPLHLGAKNVCIDGDGPRDAEVLIIGQNPGREEDRQGRPFIGPSGKILKAQVAKAGLQELKIRYTNTVRCLTPNNREPTAKEIKACKPYLDAEIKLIAPKYIVPLGAVATKAVAKAKVTTAHGQMIEKDGQIVMPTYHPAATFRDPSKLQVIQQDFARLKRQIDGTLGATQESFKHLVVRNRDDLHMFWNAFGAAEEYAYDTETNGLFLRKPDFVLRSVAIALPECSWVIPLEMPGGFYAGDHPAQAAFFRVLARKAQGKWACVFHGKYDSGAIRSAYEVALPYHFDAMLAHYIIDENQDHDLKYVSRIELDCPEYDLPKNLKVSDEKENPKWRELIGIPENREKYWEYNARDAWNTLHLARKFAGKFRRNTKLRRLFNELVMPSSYALESIEAEGLPVDHQHYSRMETETLFARNAAMGDLDKSAGHEVNWNSPQQVGKVLYEDFELPVQQRTPTGAPSTSESAIVDLKGKHPIVNKLLHFRELDKIVGTYLQGWKQYIVGDRIYFSYKQTGTVCFTVDTLLSTQRGVLPFDRINCGDVVLTHKARWRKILRKVLNGRRPVVTVRLANGVMLTTTENHEYRTASGWYPAGKLTRGDVVITYGSAELWSPILGWEETYEVSTWGRIRHVTRGTIIKQRPKGRWGHLKVSLIRKNGKRSENNLEDCAVHRLVAGEFIPNPELLPEVRHLDGCAWNNNVCNLAWGTRADNWQDAINHGSNRKTKHWQCKLTQEQVDEIRKRPRTRGDDGVVARSLGVSRELIRDIRLEKRWPIRELKLPTPQTLFGKSKVVSISRGEELTYGLVVEEDHSHVTNGIVTHNTGRFSSRLHPIPTDGDIRSIIATGGEDEWNFVAADLSQAELRIAAEMSGDLQMISAYRNGEDVHWKTLMFMIGSGATDATKLSIQTAKMYCMRHLVPPNRTGCAVLQKVWQANQGRESTESSITLSHQEGTKGGRRVWGGTMGRSEPLLERRNIPNTVASMEKEVLRALRDYQALVCTSSQSRSERQPKIQLSDALSLLSCITPSVAYELSKDWKDWRNKAKRVNFAFLYGMYENKFMERARVDYDWDCPYDEAHRMRQAYFELYTSLEPWHNRCKRIARIDGYVTNMFGRVRRIPAIQSTDKLARMEAERQAVNSPVQGTIGDWKAAAMVEIHETIDRDQFKLCGEHHDALLGLVRRGCEDDVLPRVRRIMERPRLLKTFKIKMSVPMVTDIAIGPWGRGVTYHDPT